MTLGGKPMDSMCQGMALHVKDRVAAPGENNAHDHPSQW